VVRGGLGDPSNKIPHTSTKALALVVQGLAGLRAMTRTEAA
jgi:hypothetical protein